MIKLASLTAAAADDDDVRNVALVTAPSTGGGSDVVGDVTMLQRLTCCSTAQGIQTLCYGCYTFLLVLTLRHTHKTKWSSSFNHNAISFISRN